MVKKGGREVGRMGEGGGEGEERFVLYNLSISLANVPTQTTLQSNIPQLELSTHGWVPATTGPHFILISVNLVFSP